jgi:hypothetical protein
MTDERRDPQPQQRQDNQPQQPIQDLEARQDAEKADNVKGGRAVYTSDPQEGGQ